jgi:hypothetical protein
MMAYEIPATIGAAGGLYARNYLVKPREHCPRYSDGSVVGTRQLTPRFSLVLEKLLVPPLIKTFHAFGGIRMFMAVFTRARHLSLSRGMRIQFTPFHPTSIKIHFNTLLPSTPRSPKTFKFPRHEPLLICLIPRTCFMLHLPHLLRFCHQILLLRPEYLP